MNDFSRTQDSLDILHRKKELFLEDILGVIVDLLQDTKDISGKPAFSMDIKDEERFVSNLLNAGRFPINIVKKKKDEIQNADLAEKVEHQQEKLQQLSDILDEKECQIRGEIEQIEKLIEEQTRRERQYQEQQKALEETRNKYNRLKQNVEELADTIARCSKYDLVSLQNEKENLQKKRQDVFREKEAMQIENEGIRSEIFEEIEKNKAEKQKQLGKIEALRAEQRQLESEIDKQKAACMQLQNTIKSGEEEKESHRRKFESDTIKLHSLEREILEKKLEQSKLDSEIVKLLEQKERLEDRLKTSDAESLQRELDDLKKKTVDAETEYFLVQKTVEEARQNYKKMEDNLQMTKEQKEKEKSLAMDQNAAIEERIRQLDDEINQYRKQKAAGDTKLKDMLNELEGLKQWFAGIEIQENEDRYRQAAEKVELFRQVQTELIKDGEVIGFSNFKANELRNRLREDLNEIERRLNDYRQQYSNIVKVLSDR